MWLRCGGRLCPSPEGCPEGARTEPSPAAEGLSFPILWAVSDARWYSRAIPLRSCARLPALYGAVCHTGLTAPCDPNRRCGAPPIPIEPGRGGDFGSSPEKTALQNGLCVAISTRPISEHPWILLLRARRAPIRSYRFMPPVVLHRTEAMKPAIFSFGVIHPRHFRGRSFRYASIRCKLALPMPTNEVFLGCSRRIRPLVFSLVPRSQE